MHLLRRARPTLRLIREDLRDGWANPFFLRALADGNVSALHPLSELPHPVVVKAAEALGENLEEDQHEGLIKASTAIALLELKTGQWRAAVWRDADGVNWVVAAGLAKGDHEDHEDFYKRVERADRSGSTAGWLPTDKDYLLLKRERAAKHLTDWEQRIQSACLPALEQAVQGDSGDFALTHPITGATLGAVRIDCASLDDGSLDSVEVHVRVSVADSWRSSELAWQATVRVLVSVWPPEQDWDRYQDDFINMVTATDIAAQVERLRAAIENSVLAESEPGSSAHYSHTKHVAGGAVNGTSVRALCGVHFVPRQDHGAMPTCPKCEARWSALPS